VTPPPAPALLADPAYPPLKDHVIRSTGLAYYADKDRDLAAHVAGRLGKLGLSGCSAYLALLHDGDRGEAELDALIADLTIGETFFFRHKELFDALRDVVLPDVIARNGPRRQLRVWSAGCATGAEPYSVSLLLRRDLADRVAGWDVTVVGTDINREFLARAREGRFEEWALRATAEEVRRACFAPAGRSWLLAPEYREGVSFQYHNLVTHPFPSLLNGLFAFDVILCRNVTIYFSADIVRRTVGHFHECLVDGGWLLVGHSEPNLENFRAFRTVNYPGAVLYRKDLGSAAELPRPEPVPPPAAPAVWVPPVITWEASPAAAPRPPVPAARPAANPEVEVIRTLADRGAWAEALRHCQAALEADLLNPAAYFYHALVLEQAGCHAEAEDALRRVLYLDRGAVLAHYYLGLILQKQRRPGPAARSFRNVLGLLARTDAGRVFADGDGMTAGELKKLTEMHLAVLEGA
jgi:chemotaxis protein methyltransferase CheR